MHPQLQTILSELEQLASAVTAHIPSDEPFNIAHGNWTFPGVTKAELNESVSSLAALITARGGDTLGIHEQRISDYVRRLQYLRTNAVPNIWGNPALGVATFDATIQGLRQAIEPTLRNPTAVAEDVFKDVSKLRTRAAAMEARMNEIGPRSDRLTSMIERIESAYFAADQLPTDLEQLAQDRQRMGSLLGMAEENAAAIQDQKKQASAASAELERSAVEAKTLLEQCHSAYAAATSQGLAAAFTERSKALDRSMWFWVSGFIVALGLGAYFGSERLQVLSELMKSPSLTFGTATLNFLLAVVSVGAPVWFGWLASKQIGQRFRLSEDYAFKAAVSRAYEGYRREAARFDKEMEARLLSSALSRLDEQPLRFVEPDSHGSPWHELASSELVKSAMNTIPGFAEKVTEAAKDAMGAIKLVAPDKQSNKSKVDADGASNSTIPTQ